MSEEEPLLVNINRLPKEGAYPFVQVDKEMLNNKDLSWEAKGLLTYMLGMPEDWQFYQNELRRHGSAGRDKFRRMLRELEIFGYLTRFKWQDDKGQWRWSWEVFESPLLNPDCHGYEADKSPCTENPATDDPSLGHPVMVHPLPENPAIYQNESQPKINKTNNNGNKNHGRDLSEKFDVANFSLGSRKAAARLPAQSVDEEILISSSDGKEKAFFKGNDSFQAEQAAAGAGRTASVNPERVLASGAATSATERPTSGSPAADVAASGLSQDNAPEGDDPSTDAVAEAKPEEDYRIQMYKQFMGCAPTPEQAEQILAEVENQQRWPVILAKVTAKKVNSFEAVLAEYHASMKRTAAQG
jgi:hypothetical protein